MRCSTLTVLAAAAITLSACGDSRPPTPSPPPTGGGETIRGTERLGWDQQAATAAELATFRYAIYVDGIRSEMADVNCGGATSATGFPCSGRLPAMNPGQHTLELATFIVEAGVVTESVRSAPLRVTVSPAIVVPTTGTAVRRGEALPTGPPQVRVAAVSEGFDDIVDIAIAADRLFVAERRGAIRVIESGGVNPRPALIAADRIVSLALDPAFERSRQVFVLQSGPGRGDEYVLRLVRYRDVGGTFGERAILLDNIPTAQDDPGGTLRFGPDGKLYLSSSRVVMADGGRTREGQVLRLDRDGRTPSDQPAFDPVHVAGPIPIVAFDWQPRTSAAWIAERDAAVERLALAPSDPLRARQGARDAEQPLPQGTQVTAMHFYRGERMRTLRNALLVASEAGLLAVRFDSRQPQRVISVETLLEGRVRAVVSDAPGRVFVATGGSVMQIDQIKVELNPDQPKD